MEGIRYVWKSKRLEHVGQWTLSSGTSRFVLPPHTQSSEELRGKHEEEASTALNARGPLRKVVQRPVGRGPVRIRPSTGAQGLREGPRLGRNPRVRGRIRKRPSLRTGPSSGSDRGVQQAERLLRCDSRKEIQSLH